MTRRPLADAERVAQVVVDLLAPGCERIEIAGSIRRKVAEVKDIEIVAAPKMSSGGLFADLYDDDLNLVIGSLVQRGTLLCRHTQTGEVVDLYKLHDRRFYPLFYVDGETQWRLDLFCVRKPAQWGAIFAIRTGPADYSQRLVTALHAKQMKLDEGRVVSTALASVGRVIDTPEERDFIELCGLPFLPPEQRQ